MIANQFLSLYEAGTLIKRFHTTPVPAQNLAWHSWGVAMIANFISGPEGASPRLLMACLCHDLAESITGDIPAPAKWAEKGLADVVGKLEVEFQKKFDIQRIFDALTDDERKILAWSDTFEMCLYCAQQMAYNGNRGAMEIRDRGLTHILQQLGFPTPFAKELFDDCFEVNPEACTDPGHTH